MPLTNYVVGLAVAGMAREQKDVEVDVALNKLDRRSKNEHPQMVARTSDSSNSRQR